MLAALTVLSAALALVLTGGIAGVFYAYSVSVMPALNALDPETAARAMRSLNRAILNRAFFATFLGAPAAAVVTGTLLVWRGEVAGAGLSLLAAATYALGAFLPTVAINVPLNQALDGGGLVWSRFSPRWTRWNTVRAVSSAGALVLVALAVLQL